MRRSTRLVKLRPPRCRGCRTPRRAAVPGEDWRGRHLVAAGSCHAIVVESGVTGSPVVEGVAVDGDLLAGDRLERCDAERRDRTGAEGGVVGGEGLRRTSRSRPAGTPSCRCRSWRGRQVLPERVLAVRGPPGRSASVSEPHLVVVGAGARLPREAGCSHGGCVGDPARVRGERRVGRGRDVAADGEGADLCHRLRAVGLHGGELPGEGVLRGVELVLPTGV